MSARKETWRTEIVLTHTDGETVMITITGADAKKVAHVAGTIKSNYRLHGSSISQTDREYLHEERFWKQWFDFSRDFFGLGKR